MNTNTMAKVLGAGKWLVAMALAACGGSAGGATSELRETGGISGGGAQAVPVAGAGAVAGDAAVVPVGGTGGVAGGLGSMAGQSSAAGAEQGGQSAFGGSAAAGTGGAVTGAGAGGSTSGGAGGDPTAGSSGQNGDGQGGTMAGDAGSGGAPACMCSTGQCCDGCHFRSGSYLLGRVVVSNACEGPSTPGGPDRIILEKRDQLCDGVSAVGTVLGGNDATTTEDCPHSCAWPQTGPTAAFCL